jgi:hypothetical protein
LQRQLPKMTPSGLSMGVTRGLVRVNLVGVKRDLGQLPRTWVSPRGLVVSKRPSGCQKRSRAVTQDDPVGVEHGYYVQQEIPAELCGVLGGREEEL